MDEAEKDLWFITMRATGETTQFDWFRHLEEVAAAILHVTKDNDEWPGFDSYGPCGNECPPSACFKIKLNATDMGNMLEYLSQQAPWLTIPIQCYKATAISL